MKNIKADNFMRKKYDCVIIGGGIGGISASLTLARNNLSVLLVEKQCILGGLATSGLINWYEPLCDGNGTQLIFGNALELIKLASEYGATLDKRWLEEGKGSGKFATFFNHNIFACALTNLLTKEGVDITFDSLFTDVIIENKKIKSIIIETIDKKEIIDCNYVIDASGTAKVFSCCNLPLRHNTNYLSFYCHKAGNIDSNIYLRVWDIYGSNMVGDGQPDNVPLLIGNTNLDVNKYIIESHKLFISEVENKKRGLDITSIPHMPQFRMISSIVGEETIDNTYKNKHFETSIAKFGYFFEPSNTFEIPYGSLFNKNITNLFACGRIISSIDQGWDAIRVIPVCALTGELVAKAITILNKTNSENYTLNPKTISFI